MLFISIKESTFKYIPPSESIKLFFMETKAYYNLLLLVSANFFSISFYYIKHSYLLLEF